MANDVVVRIKGLKELDAALREFPAKLQKNIMRGAMRAAGKVIQKDIRANIWVRTGEMRRGVAVRADWDPRRGAVVGKVYMSRKNKHSYIAPWLEFGTQAHRIAPRKKNGTLFLGSVFVTEVNHPGISPRPVFRPAMDRNKTAAVVAAAKYIQSKLNERGINTPDIVTEET